MNSETQLHNYGYTTEKRYLYEKRNIFNYSTTIIEK